MEDSTPDYLTLAEVAVLTGIPKGNLHYHLNKHHITSRHFGGKTAYILRTEAFRLRDAIQQPWKRTPPDGEQDVLTTLLEMPPDLRGRVLAKVRQIGDTAQKCGDDHVSDNHERK